MMYVLTEAEFDDLNAAKRRRDEAAETALQRVCTLAAKHTPIVVQWRRSGAPHPWGCILDAESNPGYCDECPVRDVCPHDGKEWSQ